MSNERLTAFFLKLKTLVKRRQLDRDLDDEIAFHLAMRQEKLGAGNPGNSQSENLHYAARRRCPTRGSESARRHSRGVS